MSSPETISFSTSDGIELTGDVLPVDGARAAAIVCHPRPTDRHDVARATIETITGVDHFVAGHTDRVAGRALTWLTTSPDLRHLVSPT